MVILIHGYLEYSFCAVDKHVARGLRPGTIHTYYDLSNLIRWVGSHQVGAPGTTRLHKMKLSVIFSFLAHPPDVI